MSDTRHVLVPMDGSDSAERALEYAIDIYPNATITVLHVIDISTASERSGLAYDESVQEELEHLAREIFETAEEVITAAGFEGELETTTGFGSPTRSIVDHAEEVDAVVMGSKGRHGAARLLLGSVAETVVRRAPVPVTVVR